MSGHTPGPWIWDGEDGILSADKSMGVGSVFPADRHNNEWSYGGGVTEANARLIAAAPDLLELAECVVSENPDYGYMHGLAVAAIAKVKGAAA